MEDPGGDVIIFRSARAAACRERALVLRATGVEHAVRRVAREWVLVVPTPRAVDAARELDAYAAENHDWPQRHPSLPRHRYAFNGVVTSVAVLLLVEVASRHQVLGRSWLDAGRIDSDLVRQGEWWRSVTALTLHLGVGHLVGNLLLGSLLALIAGRQLGGGLAWFSIVVAGAAGNVVSGFVQLPGHTAVGASTAVFAALGLVGALNWRQRHEHGMRRAVRWAPLVVAAVVLAYTGAGGARTDVISHLTGFLAGVALGAYYGGFTPVVRFGPRGQWLLGLGTLALVGAAWAIAFAVHG